LALLKQSLFRYSISSGAYFFVIIPRVAENPKRG
jgi:hypothetical protein